MKHESDEIKDENTRRRRGVLFWLGRAIFILFAFFFAILILIQLPPVQKWGADFISSKIEKTLNTKVSIGGFNLHPVSDLSLTDVFIGSPEYPDDTLIMTKNLQVDFQRLWDVFYNKFTIEQIVIEDGYLNIEKKAGDTLTNLDVALLRLLPDRDTSKAPFDLDLEKISATQLQVSINDHTVGSLVKMVFPRADISLDTLDMGGQYIRAEYLDFDEPLIHVVKKITEKVTRSSVEKEDKFWSIDVQEFNWSDGKFYVDDQTKPKDTSQVYGMDYSHLFIADLDIEVDSFRARGLDIQGKRVKMHLLHQNGFEIKTLASEAVDISGLGIKLADLEIETEDSHIRNTIELGFSGYTDFKSFADSVTLHIPDADIELHIEDLLVIAPSLGKVSFIADNKDKVIRLQGDLDGIINRLRILNMEASMGGIALNGDFRSRNLTKKGAQLLNLDLRNSTVSASALKDIFPRMNVPPILNRLGVVHFTGKFDGYPDDFVAFGTFDTGLGDITMDMNLNTVNGMSRAKYSGTISMNSFDVGTFIGNKDIGRVTMTGRVIEGTGLTLESLNADITAVMSSAEFKGYTYRNARLDGIISEKMFNGTVDINDPNVDMHFEGTVDFRGKEPVLDFITRIDSVRFLQLGFGKEPIAISGIFDVDLTTGKIDEMEGELIGEKVTVRIKGVDYAMDSLSIIAFRDSVTGDRFYHIKSDVATVVLTGTFDPLTIAQQVQEYLHQHYPSRIAAPKKPVVIKPDQRMAWDIHIHDSGPWLDVVGVPNLVIRNAYTHGNLDLDEGRITGFIQLPEMHYNGFNIYGSSVNFEEIRGRVNGDLEVIAADLKENFFLEDVFVNGLVTDDSMKVRVKTDHIAEIIDEVDVEVTAGQENGNWVFSFNPIRLDLLGGSWVVPAGNRIEIRKNEFSLENFELVSDTRRIVVDDINNKGLEAFITGFDINYLNSLWVTDKFEFSGEYTLDLEVDNIYDIKQLSTVLHIPELKVNNTPYGEWILNAGMNDPKDSVKIDLVMNNNETHLVGKGAYLPPIKSIPKEKQNYLRLGVEATEFPLDFLEFLMGGNIRDTEGSVDLSLSLSGKLDKLEPRGTGKVYNGSTTIDYLGTAYSFHDQSFTITENMIDLSGTRLYDVQGNSALIQGGITHRYLKNLGLNASITSPKIIGLDVNSEENASFYGRGIGSVYATFTGTIANPNMNIESTTAEGTHIYIPLSGSPSSAEKDFVIFLENGQLPVSKTVPFNLGGVSLNMKLSITNDAIVEIIFDDNTGEVLRGIGAGDLQIGMTRTGVLSMVGEYVIEEGDYLFTNFSIVRKPFTLLPNGRIFWDGDPYDATINIQAQYTDLAAPVWPLVQEYIPEGSESAISAARERTKVDLVMTLTGSLLHPNIAFDIGFPDLTGEIRAYAETKINLMEANQNAMLEQVVGLLLTRSFLPTGISGAIVSKGFDKTLTEALSSGISSVLSGLLGDIVPEGQFLSGIDLEVGLDFQLTQNGEIANTLDDPYDSEIGVNVPIQFFDDRLTLTVGGNYVSGATLVEQDNYFAGDVTLLYHITQDRRLTLRMYNRNDLTIEGWKNKSGAGLAYRREADSLSELFSRKKKKKAEKQAEEAGGG